MDFDAHFDGEINANLNINTLTRTKEGKITWQLQTKEKKYEKQHKNTFLCTSM